MNSAAADHRPRAQAPVLHAHCVKLDAAGIGRVRVRDGELTMLELPRLVARHNALATRLAA